MHCLEPTCRNNDIHTAGDKLIGQARQAIQLTFRPSIFDCYCAALIETSFCEALTNECQTLRVDSRRPAAKNTDYWHSGVLSMSHNRATSCYAGEE